MRQWCALFAAFSAVLIWPTGLQAKWLEASSEHFVIYADDSDAGLRRYATKLESFHAAMASVTQRTLPPPTPSTRVTIYIVRSDRDVRKLLGDDVSRFIQAVYLPRAEGSIALVPEQAVSDLSGDAALIPLLHEYAHHFTISATSFPQPRWLSEGSAEFFASAGFENGGNVLLGQPAVHRGWELFNARDVTVTDLFDPAAYDRRRRENVYDAYYGKAWLLYHYLTATQKRPGQLARYLGALSAGKDQIEAARTAFGDFATLEKELDSYQRSRGMMMIRVPKEAIQIGKITVRPLSVGEGEMMPVRVRSKRGVNAAQAAALLIEARAIAARHSQDPAVLAALAEAEYDAGHDAEAIAAADGALARDPNQVNAYVQKGYALFRKAAASAGAPPAEREAAYRAALAPFVALNKIENDHPLPLLFFYLSYTRQGKTPHKNAVTALEQTMGLAPFDYRLRQLWVSQLINDKRYADARQALLPVAYNPHGGGMAEMGRQMIEAIDAGKMQGGTMIVRDQFAGQREQSADGPVEAGTPRL